MILNLEINKIESHRHVPVEDIRGCKNINNDINIRSTALVKRSTPWGEKTVLRAEYSYAINYLGPNIGYIRFEGTADYYDDEKRLEQIKKDWDQGSAPIEILNEVANTMVASVTPLAMNISKSLGLPPAVQIPKITFQKHKKKGEEPTFYHG
ncbi:MAG: hypothetical protein QMC78_05825 [Methanocellales archaeon]|nr:hypothetical protein [Methanocellales archaeon]